MTPAIEILPSHLVAESQPKVGGSHFPFLPVLAVEFPHASIHSESGASDRSGRRSRLFEMIRVDGVGKFCHIGLRLEVQAL